MDDDGEVVTVAVDDDITLGAIVLLRERKETLGVSPIQALVSAAFKLKGVMARTDAYFLDPSTTAQEIFDPTQILLSYSNINSA